MEEKDRTLGLRSVVSISVGLVIATSCLVSLGQGAGSIGVVFIGAMVIACLLYLASGHSAQRAMPHHCLLI